MKLPELRDVVGADKKVYFSFYRDKELWYRGEEGFEFPVSIEDAGSATFKSEDKSVFFMRWVRKHLEYLKTSLQEEVSHD
jgi:hypothetical protein